MADQIHEPATGRSPEPTSGERAAADEALAGVDRANAIADQLSRLFGDLPVEPTPRKTPGFPRLRISGMEIEHETDAQIACLNAARKIFDTRRVWLVTYETNSPKLVHIKRKPPDCDLPPSGLSLCQQVASVFSATRRQEVMTGMIEMREALAIPVAYADRYVGTLFVWPDELQQEKVDEQINALRPWLYTTSQAVEIAALNRRVWDMTTSVCCAFAMAIESRDPYTGGHLMRVTAYSLALANRVGIFEDQRRVLRLGGLLHDIGKVGIPDNVLSKPSSLTEVEYEIIKTHPVIGDQIITRVPELQRITPIVRHHHERWDGRGYPDGLKGQDIPYLARVVSVADAYDAMTSDRPYRSGMTHEVAMERIIQGAGSQFDAELSSLFSRMTIEKLEASVHEIYVWWNKIGNGEPVILAPGMGSTAGSNGSTRGLEVGI